MVRTVTPEEMLDLAAKYLPQRMHSDTESCSLVIGGERCQSRDAVICPYCANQWALGIVDIFTRFAALAPGPLFVSVCTEQEWPLVLDDLHAIGGAWFIVPTMDETYQLNRFIVSTEVGAECPRPDVFRFVGGAVDAYTHRPFDTRAIDLNESDVTP